MFYENELRACADELLRSSLCRWEELKNKDFPVIFEAVYGDDQREEKSPSFFNPQEVSVVFKYVKSLKEARGLPVKTEEIGIISPYHKHVGIETIKNDLSKSFQTVVTSQYFTMANVRKFCTLMGQWQCTCLSPL